MNNRPANQPLMGIQRQNRAGVNWLDVHDTSADSFDYLQQQYQLHPLHLNESVQRVQHNQVEREANYLFFVLHFPLFDAQTYNIVIGQVGIFLGRDFLVTIHHSDCPTITKLFEQALHHDDYGDTTFAKGCDYLLYLLISRLLHNISEMIDYVQVEMDRLENRVFNNDDSDALQISKVRQKIVRLSRVIGPKRVIFQDLAQQIDDFSGHHSAKLYANNTKTANRLWEVIEEARETVEIYKDADFTTSTEKTNKILMLLTLVFTFTIPITVVSTLYGMNVPLPGGIDTGAWTFLGRYTSFVILVIISLALTLSMHFYFKRKKWF